MVKPTLDSIAIALDTRRSELLKLLHDGNSVVFVLPNEDVSLIQLQSTDIPVLVVEPLVIGTHQITNVAEIF